MPTISHLGAKVEKQHLITAKCFAVIVISKKEIYKNKYEIFPML